MDLTNFYLGEKFFSDKCWETCGGSHCCKLFRLTKDLAFAPKDSQVLHLYPFERDWLIANGQLDPKFAETMNEHKYTIDGLELRFYTVRCGYEGLCPNHKFRPISCFLYPYLPYFTASGEVKALHYLSIFDDLFDRAGEPKPCTLFPKFTIEMYKGPLLKTLAHPEFFFYTNVYIRIKEELIKAFKDDPEAQELKTLPEILAGFEMMHALRRLVSHDKVHEIIKEEAATFKLLGKN